MGLASFFSKTSACSEYFLAESGFIVSSQEDPRVQAI
jgi:hypothetical protein